MDQSPKAFFSGHKSNGDYEWVCGNFERITGWKPNEVIGSSSYSLFHSEDLRKIIKSHLGTKARTQQIVYRFRTKSNRFMYMITYSYQTESGLFALTRKLGLFEIITFRLFKTI